MSPTEVPLFFPRPCSLLLPSGLSPAALVPLGRLPSSFRPFLAPPSFSPLFWAQVCVLGAGGCSWRATCPGLVLVLVVKALLRRRHTAPSHCGGQADRRQPTRRQGLEARRLA